jgi:hypothetical protein
MEARGVLYWTIKIQNDLKNAVEDYGVTEYTC